MPLTGKVALITGASQGVGQGIALALASKGADIVVASRSQDKINASADLIRKRGGKALAVQCDVKSETDLQNALDATIHEFGRLDILVNNAQEVARGHLLDVSDAAFQNNFDSGPMATFRLMKMAYPHLKDSQGTIINLLSSTMKRWDVGSYGVYAAVKAATQQITRAAANEWGKDGIRVNGIMPHAKSPALKGWIEQNPVEAKHFQASIPLQRIGECEEDIGAFVALMCMDEAGYLSGQTIGLDGGQALIG